MDKYTTTDAVEFALAGKPVEFDAAIKQLLADKMVDAVDAKREEVGKSIFDSTPVDEE